MHTHMCAHTMDASVTLYAHACVCACAYTCVCMYVVCLHGIGSLIKFLAVREKGYE